MKKKTLLLYLIISSTFLLMAQNNRVEGKIIKDFGETFNVENPEVATDTNATLKVIFDVSKSPEDTSKINSYIVTAARFLNMHADAGMDISQLKVALTIHGGAWKDILTDDEYFKKYGTKNPNTQLIKQLNDAGVDIILCGQTANFRNVSRLEANPDVKFALSAMTALLQYQNNGYQFIKF
ncbi:intracellular sulfur oxidation DsrE/DsrF family protein [Winogradskyella wandonensis]|uniref:Intracellular sulfur oxidation DsrE/DsrF family protein n=1 Tax=Winogradskyella wandonensis TaxID=1442586 RepID=A0A4R1KIY2_9FLAO|nr:DsrE family protein [Winogradskyella wandonensis]TCK64786.1 intracellular sulfur oxidation DsrE/DsrF family protein [Winogradskyella wandonensis]